MGFREDDQMRWRGVRPAHNGTQVTQNALADNGLVVLYTVPANQVFYLTSAFFGLLFVAAGNADFYVRTGGAALWSRICVQGVLAGTLPQPFYRGYWPPLEIPEAYQVVISSNAAGLRVYANIHGWVE